MLNRIWYRSFDFCKSYQLGQQLSLESLEKPTDLFFSGFQWVYLILLELVFKLFYLIYSIKGMDAHIIIDSIADILSHEDKDLCKYGHLAITLLYETVSIVTKDKIKAAKLPFFEYMAGMFFYLFLVQ